MQLYKLRSLYIIQLQYDKQTSINVQKEDEKKLFILKCLERVVAFFARGVETRLYLIFEQEQLNY